jgi:hypoxanthine phosphoribosyltransferase
LVAVHDKHFVPFISKETIEARIAALGAEISKDYEGKRPIIISILNGSFIFAADLFLTLTI